MLFGGSISSLSFASIEPLNYPQGINGITHPAAVPRFIINKSQVERQNITNLAKDGVRRRRNLHMRVNFLDA